MKVNPEKAIGSLPTNKLFPLSAFLEDQTAHYEDLIRQWNEKYEKEVQLLDQRIAETKDVMIALKLKYDELQEQFMARDEEIQEYLVEKKIKDDASTEAERKYDAIVRIQSWWRGIMVRRGNFAHVLASHLFTQFIVSHRPGAVSTKKVKET